MPQASEIAWLIPVFPLIGAVLSGLGLISINKKINNSREIVSVGLISFVGYINCNRRTLVVSSIYKYCC